MRLRTIKAGQIALLLSLVFISTSSKAQSFSTFEDVAVSIGKFTPGESYTGGAATINGGVQFSIVGVYLGLGPALFIPDNKEGRKEWTNYIGGFAQGGIMLRIPFKSGMLIAGDDFIFGVTPYQPVVGYLFRGAAHHTGFFLTTTIQSSHETYYAVGLRTTLSE